MVTEHFSGIPPGVFRNCGGEYIHPSPHVENLGVSADRYMLFDAHTAELSKKTIGIRMLASRIRENFESTRITVVQSMVLSLMNYCIGIEVSVNETLLISTQNLQNCAAKIVTRGSRKI